MIKQIQQNYNPGEIEKKIKEYWAKTNAYTKTKALRASGPDYYFVDGPPYTTGSIHLGTAWNKIIKDTVIRFKRMQKFHIRDQPGYDMHGLPIEVKVEQTIGIKSKKEIEEYGIDKFVSTCRQFAVEYQRRMTEQFKELGVWLDWENPYLTISPDYIEAAWWTLKRASDQGLLVTADRVLSWCPRCETALAEAEIEYWDEKDPSIYVKFPLKDEENVFLLVWTTTPWTLPANMAVAVHPDFTYARVQCMKPGKKSETIIILESLIEEIAALSDWEEFEVLEVMDGEDLIGKEYVPPLIDEVPYQKNLGGKWVHKIVPSKTVASENTGLVHIAPGHGPEDFEIGQEFGIPTFSPVDESGRFTAEAGEWLSGMNVKKANSVIIERLKQKNLIYFAGTVDHRYGHCWRCDSPIIYRITSQWFLRVTQIKELMLEEIEKIRWTPDWAGSSRQYDWTLNARDWCISRQRYWGIPLPIWRCSCGEIRIIGTVSELKNAKGYQEGMDLHRPWIDSVILTCEKCGKEMRRVPDVLDVWFDSGVSTWAQLGFPKDRKEFEKWWPAKWITEAHDQTRGWFYSQLAASCICFQRAPYESVLMHGWVLDPKGQPMSKSRGNVIEPASVIKEYGADALRFYMMRTNAPWEDIAFQFEGVKNARKTLNILWNVCNFATSYMALDKFDPALVNDEIIKNAFRKEDLWLISRCEKLKNDVTRHLNSYELHKATRALEEFILEDLSRWYVRLVRDRMWKEEGDSDKLAAYKTLHDVLMNVTKLLAPFCPHIAEEIYQHLDGSMESIHMLDWPAADLTRTNDKLESAMKTIQEIVEIVTKERQAQGVKLRWPLRRIIIKANSNEVMNSIKSLESILLSQANVKTIEYVDPGEDWEELILNVVPNPHAIGKVYRQWSSKIAVLLKTRPAKQVKQSVEKGEYYLGVEGQLLKIEPNMVSFTVSLPPDIIGTKFSAGELYMDFKITPEIEAEGYAREIIRRIQQMRKDAKLDIEEYIKVQLSASEKIQEFLESHKSYVMNETRARDIVFVDEPDGEMVVEWDIEGEKVVIGITSLHTKDAIKEFSMIPGLSKEASIALAEAGYRNIEGLRKAGTEALSKVSGLDKNDLRKILHYFEKSEPQVIETCPNCGVPVKMDSLVCSSCGKVLKEDKAMPKEEFIMYLLRIPRMNRVKAELLYDSGFNNLEKIKNAKLEELRALGGIGSKTAEAIFNYALYGGFEKNLKCATCGAIIRPNEISCSSCGASVSIGSQEVEEVEALESPVMEDIQLEKSFTYLIKEEKSERSYYLFKQALSKGFKGFCVTRNYPLKIRSRYDIGDVPIIWLSNVGKENSLRPKDLEKLSVSLEQFLSSTENAIILLDGLEYLITNNNFITVLRFVQSLRDQVAIREAILLLALNPSTLAQHELNLLEKEVDTTI